MLTDCKRFAIALVNELFSEDFDENESVELFQNELFITDGQDKKRITDSNISIGGKFRRYNIECQSSPDGTIIVRVFEYASQIAVNTAISENPYETRFVLPGSGIIYLRCSEDVPTTHTIIIDTPAGEVSYDVPILRIKDYSLTQLLEKKLWILIPFYFFNYKIDEMERDPSLIKSMQDTYLELWDSLDSYIDKGMITEFEKGVIKAMCDRVAMALSEKYANVKEGVEAIMGGQVLDYEIKTAYNNGWAEGNAEGRAEGNAEGVANATISAVVNMLKINIPEETVKELYPDYFEEGKKKFLEI